MKKLVFILGLFLISCVSSKPVEYSRPETITVSCVNPAQASCIKQLKDTCGGRFWIVKVRDEHGDIVEGDVLMPGFIGSVEAKCDWPVPVKSKAFIKSVE